MEKIKYTHRFLARFIIEAVTPLAVGSGNNNMMTDSSIVLDVNGLPYIPGTTIAGILRHAIGEEKAKAFFGKNDSDKQEDRRGADIMFTECRMIGKDGRVIDGMSEVDFTDDFYAHFCELPIRQHVCINHKGVASNGGKFDEQVVFKGTRFCFELELLSQNKERKNDFEAVIDALKDDSLRIGSSAKSGLGEIRICSLQTACLDLNNNNDLNAYLNKPVNLAGKWDRWEKEEKNISPVRHGEKYIEYELRIKPNDFFLFGSGVGDNEANMTPVKAMIIKWDDESLASFQEESILIPGASIKGALSHRVAFYYNLFTEQYADELSEEDWSQICGSNNSAVRKLFGYEGEKRNNKPDNQIPGNVMISDVILDRRPNEKLLNHVSIDRFTGGAIKGALFSEKVVYNELDQNEVYIIRILVRKQDYDLHVVESLEKAMLDICNGMLPLGGGVNRGNGCFTGNLYKNGNEIKNGTTH